MKQTTMQPDPESETRDEQAIAWFVRLKDNRVTERERRAFRRWLSEDPRNHDAFNAAKRLWGQMETPAAALGADGWHRRGLGERSHGWRAAALAACLALAVLGTGLLWRDGGLIDRALADHATRPGERGEVTLADGSRVYLDGDSAISVEIGARTRHVGLIRGRAWFDVARKEDMPFVVDAGGTAVRVLGTAFAVDREADTTSVTVERGRVLVSDGSGGSAELTAGLQARVEAGHVGAAEKVEPETVLAWRRGLIVLDQAPLGRVVDELERMQPGRVVIPDRQLRGLKLSGVFRADDPSAVIEAFHSALGLRTLSVPGLATVVYR